LDRARHRPGRCDLVRDPVEAILEVVDEVDPLSALTGEPERRRPAEAAAAAGDENDLASMPTGLLQDATSVEPAEKTIFFRCSIFAPTG
jgi:hypothetical protein